MEMKKLISAFFGLILSLTFVMADSFFTDSGELNRNFYYALAVAIVGVLIILVIIFLLLKKPKNKF